MLDISDLSFLELYPVQVKNGNGLDYYYLAALFCVMLGIFVNDEILVLQMMASPEVSLQMIASGAKVFQTPRIPSSQSGLIILGAVMIITSSLSLYIKGHQNLIHPVWPLIWALPKRIRGGLP